MDEWHIYKQWLPHYMLGVTGSMVYAAWKVGADAAEEEDLEEKHKWIDEQEKKDPRTRKPRYRQEQAS